MNKQNNAGKTTVKSQAEKRAKEAVKVTREIKYQESPVERALKLSSEEALARAIRDLINRDQLN